MNDPENFLGRWSRRKRETTETASQAPPECEAELGPSHEDISNRDPKASKVDPAPDLSDLPAIDAIAADTDVRGFLRPGVPPELTRAALRRAWSADPAIRDFVGLVENGWDFNDPNAMAGFGAISPEEVSRLLAQAAGTFAPKDEADSAKVLNADKKGGELGRADVGETAPAHTRDVPSSEADDAAAHKNDDV